MTTLIAFNEVSASLCWILREERLKDISQRFNAFIIHVFIERLTLIEDDTGRVDIVGCILGAFTNRVAQRRRCRQYNIA